MRIGPITAGILAAALLAGPSLAQPRAVFPAGGGGSGQSQDDSRPADQRRLVPLGQVIEHLRRLNPGPSSHSLDAEMDRQGDRPVYRVRWMTGDGQVIDYIVDAVTGQILSGG